MRAERKLTLYPGELPTLFFLLRALGLRSAFYRPAHRARFQLGNAVISVKTRAVIGDHFEIELPGGDGCEGSGLAELIDSCGLWCWNAREYQARIQEGMAASPARPLEEILPEAWPDQHRW